MKRYFGIAILLLAIMTLLFTGVAVYANSDGDSLILNFKDTEGNLLNSVECVAGEIPDPSDINASVFDSVSGKVIIPDGWYWKLDGENETKLRALSADEISALAGKKIEVYPKTSEHT